MEDLIETAPCGFVSILDDGTIERTNTTLALALGYDSVELQGGSVDKILPVASRIFYQTHVFPLLKLHGKAEEVYLTLRTFDGSPLPALLNGVRRERHGRTVNDWVLIPMKERNEYENAILTAKRQAEEAIRAKDQFVAAVSHELRTPLHSIMGWLQILKGGRQQDPEIVPKALGAIERGTNSLKRLIEDLIDLSRINSGKLRMSVDRVDVARLIQAAIDIVRPSVDAKSLDLKIDMDPDAGPVSGDPERLQQVLWNLLSNAIKFTPKGGSITVNLRRVDSSVELRVADSGKGISGDFLPYVFDRFRQDDAGAARRSGGLGLGMAIAKHIVELHGGTIRAESQGEGHGSAFTVRLPLMTVHRSEPFLAASLTRYADRPVPGELGGLEGIWVLVVEDDPHSRSMLSTVLEHAGAQVLTAASVAEGLDQFRKYRPHIIVSDIELSDGDGYFFISEVRELEVPTAPPVPAIALTAHAGPADRIKALAAGFNIHLAKPVEPIELILAISGLAHRGQMSASVS